MNLYSFLISVITHNEIKVELKRASPPLAHLWALTQPACYCAARLEGALLHRLISGPST